MKTEKIFFKNTKGEQLSAKIELPEKEVRGYALFAHCFTCNKNLTAVRNIAKSLTSNGIAVLRFDFTGLGESEGEFEQTNFSSNVDDLISAATFMKENYSSPDILIGHSLGGAAVMFASPKLESVKAVVTIGAPSNPKHVSHLLKSGIEEIEREGEAKIVIGGREFKIQKHFLQSINEKNTTSILKDLNKALLVMHSPKDLTVGIENAAQIYQAAIHPKSFISLDDADHLLSDKKDSQYAGEMISTWASRYIN